MDECVAGSFAEVEIVEFSNDVVVQCTSLEEVNEVFVELRL